MKTFSSPAVPPQGGVRSPQRINPPRRVNFDEIKRATDIVRVVESYGVVLRKSSSGNFKGLCPFHEEKTPSFYVTPSKGLFGCFGCDAGGDVIRFVARKEGLSDKEAALKLCTQIPGVRRAVELAPPPPQPSVLEVERAKLLQRVTAFYAKTLFKDRAGLDYLKRRNLSNPTMLETFQIGYCNGTLNKALPKSGDIIEQLKAIGILDKRGEEILKGRVIVPIFDVQGNVAGLYARNVQPCPPDERHRYLAGPHKGVFNGACAKTAQTVFITEAIFDAMALWQAGQETSPGQAGFRNAIALYGNKGWTPDHETLIRENGIVEAVLCLDNDETSRAQTATLKTKLGALGVKRVHVVEWPDGMKDAAEFFMTHSAAEFEALLKAANPEAEINHGAHRGTETEEITMTAEGFAAVYAARRYELFAIEKPSPAKLKATIKATASVERQSSSACGARFHFDTVDFFLNRSRRNFIVEAARLFQETAETIEADLNRLTLQVQSYAAKRLEEKTPRVTLISDTDKAEGLKLGRDPDLVGEISRDLAQLGLVGEQRNGLLAYLTMTSRKMEDPLALLILSASGAGKSHLQDAVLSLCPDEDLIKLTSLSDRALFYKGEDSLKHKALAIEEEAGAIGADYAIRNLISAKKLVNEATIKNPLTGRMETQVNRVNGPASVLKTTTNPETNAETRSRFFITSVDESAGQTRAILAAQRQSHTLDGLLRKKQAGAILARHHAFQRLLRPLHVVNPFEPLLTYGDDRLLIRRDNPKYLHLILAVAFLHQMQRPLQHHPALGDYIEVTLADIAVANDLMLELFGQSLDDLSSSSRRLLGEIAEYVREQKGRRFNRRQLRETFKWSDTRLRAHLDELVRLEYVLPIGGGLGKAFEYELAGDADEILSGKRFVPGLKSVEELRREAYSVLGQANPAAFSGGVAAQKGGVAATPPLQNGGVARADSRSENGNERGNLAALGGGHIPGKKINGARATVRNGTTS